MRFYTACAIIAMSISELYASGVAGAEVHHASITDLFAPLVNVVILLSALIWKIKTPLKQYFVSKSEEIANTLERASLKSKEAHIMLEGETRKLGNLKNEIVTIHEQSQNDVKNFEKNLSKDTEDKTQKLKLDANSKIQADKKFVMNELNTELINQVILKTKTTIKTNKQYQNKVSTKLLQDL
jgi:F0F1-type ATP synthase membrane subunit b/b'